MSYSDRTKSSIEKAADSVPIGIQLEVNTEIFITIRNLITAVSEIGAHKQARIQRLNEMIRLTVEAQADIESRNGFGIDRSEQMVMLEEALAIKNEYFPEISFQEVHKPEGEFIRPEPTETYDPAQADFIFKTRVWPVIAAGKPHNTKTPVVYLVGGQPGSGKSRMAATVLKDHHFALVQTDPDQLLGFHPRYRELQNEYGLYRIYVTRYFAEYIARLAFLEAVKERCHILLESNFIHSSEVLASLAYLREAGYRIVVMLRACPRLDSWTYLQQLYQQQLLKAPALARIVSREYHDQACDAFVKTALEIRTQELYDHLIIKSDKGLLYDSDDLPTENVATLLRERLSRGEEE